MVDDDSYLIIRLEVSVPPDAYVGRNLDTVKLATKVCGEGLRPDGVSYYLTRMLEEVNGMMTDELKKRGYIQDGH
ncbi:hypothetical protein [Mycobacteroides chelonae]|uniref:hypothetical protein n=1 Tax=Mycobacteroides chelonae TaxID=1774 RepID=UPI000991F0EB|nr:hypothetical protein [Mycobacteroides chelonae]